MSNSRGIWIRSADRRTVGNFAQVALQPIGGRLILKGYLDGADEAGTILGEYESEDQCLKALDNLEDHIRNNNSVFRMQVGEVRSCETCMDLGKSKKIYAELAYMVASDDAGQSEVEVTFCPSCGRRLDHD
jgi:gamma-glutamylcyclotransferase (GGCT)/AIG2-like uncharacterized protein YtfP